MKKNNLVSVIIPTYNVERFIKQALESVVMQTYKNIEIIVVDDCSSDLTMEIVEKIKEESDKTIVIYRQNRNMGVAYARNKAMELANGRYIAFLDSDDYWEENKLEKQLALIKETDATLCYTAIDMVDEEGRQLKKIRNIPIKLDYAYLLRNTAIATSTVLVDLKKISNFKMPLQRSGQDYATWLKILRECKCAVGVNEVLCHYRQTTNSLSSKKYKSIKQVWDIQTKQEHIKKREAFINTICFVWNGMKKYLF